jgi:hypothetical protein
MRLCGDVTSELLKNDARVRGSLEPRRGTSEWALFMLSGFTIEDEIMIHCAQRKEVRRKQR